MAGGAGSARAPKRSAQLRIELPMLHLGLPDAFIDHGDPGLLLNSVGLDAAGIEESIRARFGGLLQAPRRARSVA